MADHRSVDESLKKLFEACNLGDMDEVKKSVVRYGIGPVMDAEDCYGDTAMHMVSGGGQVEVARYLVVQMLDRKGFGGRTPLHQAARNGHCEMAEFLLQNGANSRALDKDGRTPLDMAHKRGHLTVAKAIQRHEQAGKSKCGHGNNQVSKGQRDHYHIGKSVSPLAEKPYTMEDPKLQIEREFLEACLAGHLRKVTEMIDDGTVDICEAMDVCNRETAIHKAAEGGHVDVVSYLLQRGFDVDAKSWNMYTPLHLAAEFGNATTCATLINNGAQVDIRECNGRSPIHLALMRGHVDVVRLLLEKGPKAEVQGPNGMSYLHCAAQGGHFHIVRYLLERGADPLRRDGHGHTASRVASDNGHTKVAAFLQEEEDRRAEHGTISV